MDDIREYYRILDLEPGASFEEIKRSYRDLVKVWHPDRFGSDPKLRAKAEEKLKRINLAYEQLSNEAQQAAGSPPQERANAESNASQEAQRTNTTADAEAGAPPAGTRGRKIDLWTYMTKRASVVVAAILVMILCSWVFSSMSEKSRESAIQKRTPSSYPGLNHPTLRPITFPVGDTESAVAQFNLGLNYANGIDAPKDVARAFGYYQKAAEQGHAGAENNLGCFYDSGTGTLKDEAKAFEWFRKAAMHGNVQAQINLARMYADARAFYIAGDPNDPEHPDHPLYSAEFSGQPPYMAANFRAYAWFNLAASQNAEGAAKLRDEVGAHLATDVKLKAQMLSAKLGAEIRLRGKNRPVQHGESKPPQADNTPPASPEPPADESKGSGGGSTSANNKSPEPGDAKTTSKRSIYGQDGKLDLMKTMPTTGAFKVAPAQVQVKVNANTQLFLEAKIEASQQSQRLATAKYPELKHEGSAFHMKFMELYDRAKSDGKGLLDDPNWPMKFADLAATALRAYDTLSFGDSKSVVIKKLRQSTRLRPYSTDAFKPQPDQMDGAYFLEVGGEPFRTYFTFDKDQLAEVAFCSLPVDILAYQGRVHVAWKAIREIAVLRFGEPTSTWGFPSVLKVMNAHGSQFLSDKWDLDGKEVTVGVSCGDSTYYSQLTITDKVRKDAIKKGAAGGL